MAKNTTTKYEQESEQPVEEKKIANDSVQIRGTHFTKDVNARTVFQDPVMCCQFLKGYSGIDIFKNIKPENILDETKKYQAYLGITFESDTVNKIVLDDILNVPVFLVSLIEHKGNVDYDITMQLLKYMVCIWTEYGKEKLARKEDNPANKEFEYPPIIPIVYYEGKARWTVGLNLKDRISMSDMFPEYIPDFSYRLICNYNYTNEELLSKEDEISLFMMLNKIHTAEDVSAFLRLDDYRLNEILKKSPEHTLKIIADAMWSLCMKIKMPQEEAVDCVGKVLNRDMGYLFENMEDIDIQEMRRTAKEAKTMLAGMEEQLEKTKEELEGTKEELEGTKEELEGTKEELEGTKEELEGTKEELEGTKEELEGTKEELEGAKEELEGTKEELEGTKEELVDEKRRADKAEASLEEALKKIRELEGKLNFL